MRVYVAILIGAAGVVLTLAGINGSGQQLFRTLFGAGHVPTDAGVDPSNPKGLTPAGNGLGINGSGPTNGSTPPGTQRTPGVPAHIDLASIPALAGVR